MAEDNSELEVTTPAGSFRARGTDIVSLVGLISVFAVMFLVYNNGIEAKAAQLRVAENLQKVADIQSRFADSQDELGFLISLTADQRTKLRLEMPESLRKKLRDR